MEYYILTDEEETLGIITSGDGLEARVMQAVMDHHCCEKAILKNKSAIPSGWPSTQLKVDLVDDTGDIYRLDFSLERMPVY